MLGWLRVYEATTHTNVEAIWACQARSAASANLEQICSLHSALSVYTFTGGSMCVFVCVVSFCRMQEVTYAYKILVIHSNGYEFKKMRANWRLMVSREGRMCLHNFSKADTGV